MKNVNLQTLHRALLAILFAALVLVFGTNLTFGELLYSQTFDANDTVNWTVNDDGLGTNAANCFFDYSTIGIPPAPNSGGTTRGLKLGANLNPATAPPNFDQRPALSVSPIGKNFFGDYTLTFDWWHNYIGPLNTGATGSTMLSTFGILTSGTVSNNAGAADGVFFAATGDGQSAFDYRAYSPEKTSGYTSPPTDPSIDSHAKFEAGGQNNTNAYYTSAFPSGVSAPILQQINYPSTQVGTTPAGTPGFQWHQVEIKKAGGLVSWRVDGVLLITVDTASFFVPNGGADILFGHSDTNNTTSSSPSFADLDFTLIDNVRVIGPILQGDFNRDQQVTAADIPAMLVALTDLNAYENSNGLSDTQLLAIGDLNNSGTLTNADMQSLLDLIANNSGSGSVSSVPEPSSPALFVLGAILCLGIVGHPQFQRSAICVAPLVRKCLEISRQSGSTIVAIPRS